MRGGAKNLKPKGEWSNVGARSSGAKNRIRKAILAAKIAQNPSSFLGSAQHSQRSLQCSADTLVANGEGLAAVLQKNPPHLGPSGIIYPFLKEFHIHHWSMLFDMPK